MRVPLSGRSRSIGVVVMLLVPTAAAAGFVVWSNVAPASESRQARLGDANQSRLSDVRLFAPRSQRPSTAAHQTTKAGAFGAGTVALPSGVTHVGDIALAGTQAPLAGRAVEGIDRTYTSSASRRYASAGGSSVTRSRSASGSSGGFSFGGGIGAGGSFSGGVSGTASPTQSGPANRGTAAAVSTRAAASTAPAAAPAPAPRAPAVSSGGGGSSSGGGSSNGGGSSSGDGSSTAPVADAPVAAAAPPAAVVAAAAVNAPAAAPVLLAAATAPTPGTRESVAARPAGGEPVLGATAPSPAPTPEPLSIVLVGSGLVGLWSTRKYFR